MLQGGDAAGRRDKRPVGEELIRQKLVTLMLGLAVLAAGVLLVFTLHDPQPIEGLVIHERPMRGHATDLAIEPGALPPVGGVHADRWQNCGVYRAPLGIEHAIHSMEHGVVWITYSPDLSATAVHQLEARAYREPFLLLSPFPTQAAPIALTAWGVQLAVESAADPRIDQFIDRYRLGPTAPERGASCSGGVGEPLN